MVNSEIDEPLTPRLAGRSRWERAPQPLDQAERVPLSDQAVREMALSRLDSAPRSSAELAGWVRARGASDAQASEVVAWLEGRGYLDDRDYARRYVAQQIATRQIAPAQLERLLAERGITQIVISETLAEISTEQVSAQALAVARKKARQCRQLAAEVAQRRMLAQLGRKGYSPDLARRVVRQAWEEVAVTLTDCD